MQNKKSELAQANRSIQQLTQRVSLFCEVYNYYVLLTRDSSCYIQEIELVQAKKTELAQAHQKMEEQRQRVSLACGVVWYVQ